MIICHSCYTQTLTLRMTALEQWYVPSECLCFCFDLFLFELISSEIQLTSWYTLSLRFLATGGAQKCGRTESSQDNNCKHRRVRLKTSVPHNVHVYISSRCALWSPSLKISISNDSINTNVGSQCALKSGSVLECSNNWISCPLNADEYLQIKEKTFRVIKWHLHCSQSVG